MRAAALPVVCSLALGAGALADTYDFKLNAGVSGVGSTILVGAPVAGTFMGDYDPDTNPGGTQTRPGIFGGSGNNPIDYSADATFGGDNATPASGSFRLAFDLELGVVEISNVELDLLGGEVAELPLTIAISYDTFHTVNPTGLFPGGFTLPIPLGSATLMSLTAVSAGLPGVGTITPTGPGTFDIAIIATLEVAASADFLGTPVEIPPTALPLPLVGTLELTEGDAIVKFAIDVEQMQTIPGPIGEGFEGLPLGLPTVLPPGGTANLLFGGEIAQIDVEIALGIDLIADGESVCPADCEGDGDLDLFDYLCFQGRFADGDPYADFQGDGDFDIFDFMAFQNSFIGGCAF